LQFESEPFRCRSAGGPPSGQLPRIAWLERNIEERTIRVRILPPATVQAGRAGAQPVEADIGTQPPLLSGQRPFRFALRRSKQPGFRRMRRVAGVLEQRVDVGSS